MAISIIRFAISEGMMFFIVAAEPLASLDPELGYVPSIPLPFYGRKKWWQVWVHYSCHCGAGFGSEQDYRAHYALNHIDPL